MTLHTPFTFRSGRAVRNRLVLAPLTNTQSHADGTLGEDELAFYVRRAKGGFGIIETCAALVSPEGASFPGQLGVHSDAHLPGLTRIAEGVQALGALAVAQLQHGGGRALPELTGRPPLAPTAFVRDGSDRPAPHVPSTAELENIGDAFIEAGLRCAKAGFGGVELHGAHGYLLNQLLSTDNDRDDAHGGSLENRARLLRRITRDLRRRAPEDLLIGVRLSPEDFGAARGMDVDEMCTVAGWLVEDGVDVIHLSLWDHRKPSAKHPGVHPLALFRKVLPPEIALVAAGAVWTREEAEAVLELGADLVALGKSAILDPDWPLRSREPGFKPLRGPLAEAQFAERAVGPAFVRYLERFEGMVKRG
ncbi:MAG TPA: NADH:flavin oxidoreductase [Myxococcaceae bacterium]|nr:NADH:flavin oxidoreductase [Myxococcaceae bacterium]